MAIIDYKALATFRYEIRKFLNFSERAGRSLNIEPQQHQALLAIKGLPREVKVTIGMLAERLQIQHHSAVELTDRLATHGLIRRTRSPSDRRQVLLRLTVRGQKLLRDLSLAHRAELLTAGPRLIEALKAAIRNDKGSRTAKDLARLGTVAGRAAKTRRTRTSR
jgi:DNA-binding MarR family transcriptional regulator